MGKAASRLSREAWRKGLTKKSNFCKSPSQSPTATALPEGEPNKKPSFQLQSFYNFYNSLPVRGGRSQIAPTEKRWRFATEGNVFLSAQEAGGTRPPLQTRGMFWQSSWRVILQKKINFFDFYTSVARTNKTNSQTILGSGPKMVAGAIVQIKRTEARLCSRCLRTEHQTLPICQHIQLRESFRGVGPFFKRVWQNASPHFAPQLV